MDELNSYEKIQAFITEEVDKRLFDVRDYAPSYYENNKVYKELLRNENLLAQDLNDIIDKWFNNQFVYSADENGCTVFERELGIAPLAEASLKDRRLNIISYLAANNTYLSYAWLHDQFRRILDDDEFTLDVDYDKYILKIVFTRLPYSLTRLLVNLRWQVPANIIFEITFNKKPIPEPQYKGIVKVMFGEKLVKGEGTY